MIFVYVMLIIGLFVSLAGNFFLYLSNKAIKEALEIESGNALAWEGQAEMYRKLWTDRDGPRDAA